MLLLSIDTQCFGIGCCIERVMEPVLDIILKFESRVVNAAQLEVA